MFKISSRALSSVSFASFGSPSSVLKVAPAAVSSSTTTPLDANDVKIQIKVCPVTSEDIRAINGLSFNRPHVGVAGTFGVGTVSATGTSVKSFPPNSQVLALSPSGTWTNQITTNSSLVFNVSSLTPEQAALVPEVASAWSILNQSVGQLPSGTTVIRTKDNSTVFNLAFDAIAKSKGYQVIVANESDFSNTKFQESVAAKGGASLILSSSAGRGNRHCFRLLNQNGTVVTYNGLKIPSLQETTGVEGPTTKLIFNNHRLSGFNFSSLLLNDHNSGKEAVEAAVQLLIKDNGAAKIENQIKKFSEDKVLEAILSSEAGDSVLLTIN